MVRIVVFDSGFGSLSIIKPLKKKIKSEIIYIADQKNFPYGKKSYNKLKIIINDTIRFIESNFSPNIIIVGSNTPSILLPRFQSKTSIIGVLPPLCDANKKTESKNIAILSTQNVIKSKELEKLIQKNIPKKIKTIKINASPLVELVESGYFIDRKQYCIKKINSLLSKPFKENNIDVVTLSSTHLPFLLPMMNHLFPQISFLDPAEKIAENIAIKFKNSNDKKNSLTIFTSGNTSKFQKKLRMIGIKNKVNKLIIK